MSMKWPLVTGADAYVFPNLLIFLESVSQYMPDAKIYVADFGLSESQRLFLEKQGMLLPMPEKLKDFQHAWYRKASLYDYLIPLGVEGFVWLDCDMILTEDIRPALLQLETEMRQDGTEIAICQDAANLDFQGFADLGYDKNADIEPFVALASAMGCSMHAPYLNTGFFLVNGMELPMLWGAMTRKQHEWLLFEQCSMNLLVQNGSRKLRLLDCREWNAHGPMLKDVLTEAAPSPSRIIHVTSQGDLHFNKEFSFDLDGRKMHGNLKLFLRDDLRKILLDNFTNALKRYQTDLVGTGVIA